ncbi:MAG: hypothetical protein H8E68_05020 [Kiritimatiellaeota bacterium]|nr:hypothetical protein [Kiritimatiellota bacterium]
MTKPLLSKKMFPASLLLEGRSCLIVGGGRVAARKTAKLLEAGAALTVVAPSIREQIKAMDGIRLAERPFEEEDLQGVFIVFALTDDSVLNRRVVALCGERGILCSAADGSWVDGDLTMPASFSGEGLTVAVSTGGRACRRARLLRESLSRHIEFLQDVDLFMIGGDCSTLGFQCLEKLKARRSEIEKILPGIQGVHEFMILDTCNRFEMIGLVSGHTDLSLFLKGFPLSINGMDAFRRLAEIAAGLRSGICGETRIVAQIKEALSVAHKNGWAGSFLQGWIDQTLRISKEIRHATEPHIPALELEDIVFQTLEKKKAGQASSLSGFEKILLIGRGEIGQGLAEKLPGAVQISGRDDDELRAQLPAADVVICATGSPDFVIGEAHRSLLKENVMLIDLSLPRNIDPALPGVVDLSMLRVASPEIAEKLLAQAGEIIESYAAEYERLVRFENHAE